MKKLYLTIAATYWLLIFSCATANYTFVPTGWTKISDTSISEGTPLYYKDGTKADYFETMERVRTKQAKLEVFADAEKNAKVAVVRIKPNIELQIQYPDIPENLKYFGVSFGNADSNVVVLNTPGGPFSSLLEVNNMFQEFLKEANLDYNAIFGVNVHQFQTLETTKYTSEIITFEEAKKNSAKTTRILGDFIRYFKAQGKKVYVLGISYGAFCAAESLYADGNIADKYIIMVGRLDMTPAVWEAFAKGDSVTFDKDGTTLLESERATLPEHYNMSRIAAAFGHKRYTQLLADVDMSNVTYIYATNDEAVGRLTDAEIAFLRSRNAKVIEHEGGHDIFVNYLNLQRFLDKN